MAILDPRNEDFDGAELGVGNYSALLIRNDVADDFRGGSSLFLVRLVYVLHLLARGRPSQHLLVLLENVDERLLACLDDLVRDRWHSLRLLLFSRRGDADLHLVLSLNQGVHDFVDVDTIIVCIIFVVILTTLGLFLHFLLVFLDFLEDRGVFKKLLQRDNLLHVGQHVVGVIALHGLNDALREGCKYICLDSLRLVGLDFVHRYIELEFFHVLLERLSFHLV